MNALRAAVLICSLASAVSFAQETNPLPTTITIGSVTYSNVVFGRVSPAWVSIRHSTGAASIALEKLSPELQQRFGYDPKKAADYRVAERAAEAARQEARQNQWAAQAAERERQVQQEAEKQKQVAEAAAKQATEDAATRQADEAKAKKAQEDFFVGLGRVMMIKFSYATNAKLLSDGKYEANLYYNDDVGFEQRMYVTFPQAGFNFMKQARSFYAPNSWVVYGRPYTANLQNVYGSQFADTGYYLVGMRGDGKGYASW